MYVSFWLLNYSYKKCKNTYAIFDWPQIQRYVLTFAVVFSRKGKVSPTLKSAARTVSAAALAFRFRQAEAGRKCLVLKQSSHKGLCQQCR